MTELEVKEESEAQPGRLKTPGKQSLRAIPLGGLGEIGLNAFLLHCGDDMILIDCGQMTPEAGMPGIDMVIPDFAYLIQNKDKLRGVFLTHGHEDHNGALPYFLPEADVPVYGAPLTLGLARIKLREYELLEKTRLIEIEAGKAVRAGCMKVVPFRVTHSIADAMGYVVETPAGAVVFSGDYKFEPNPGHGESFDAQTLVRYADEGVLALFSDSTNVERKGLAPSEKKVRDSLDAIFAKARKTIIVSTFASSIHRIQSILDLAQKHKRYVIVTGLNMARNITMALDMGYLNADEKIFRDPAELSSIKPRRRLLLSTGSQGEPFSVMSRLALDDYKWLSLEKGDSVVLSARMIPGNERPILKMVNHFTKRGAEVFYEITDLVHVSGHAYRDDMKRLIKMVRPRYVIPVHGEHRHLAAHKKLAMELGYGENRVKVMENGSVLELNEKRMEIVGEVNAGRSLVDGKGVGDVEEYVLRDRRRLSRDGMLAAILVIDSHTGKLLSGPHILTRGFVFVQEKEESLEEARQIVLEVFNDLDSESKEDWGVAREAVRRALKRFVKKRMARYPMILPVVMEL